MSEYQPPLPLEDQVKSASRSYILISNIMHTFIAKRLGVNAANEAFAEYGANIGKHIYSQYPVKGALKMVQGFLESSQWLGREVECVSGTAEQATLRVKKCGPVSRFQDVIKMGFGYYFTVVRDPCYRCLPINCAAADALGLKWDVNREVSGENLTCKITITKK